MNLLRLSLLAAILTLAAHPASGQDKVSKPATILVSHTVTLTWDPQPLLIGVFVIYVSSTSGSGYRSIGEVSCLGPETFDDLNTVAGNTYYYVVTALDEFGFESAYSNEVQVTIPAP